MKVRLGGVRPDTPSESCGVAAGLVKVTRARLDLARDKVENIFVRGGITPECIKHFIENRAPVRFFGEGSYISWAKPINFTVNFHEKVSL